MDQDQIGEPRLASVVKVIERLRRIEAAVIECHSQHADDRCWMDITKVYEAAGLPPPDNSIGNPVAMMQNCHHFVMNHCQAGGPWKSYAELEAENEQLRKDMLLAAERIAKQSELLSKKAEAIKVEYVP